MATSYVSSRMGPLARLREVADLYHLHTHDLQKKTARLIRRLDRVGQRVERATGLRLEGLKMLDIGPGQLFLQMAYFARQNDVVGIDLDMTPQRLGMRECLRMVRANGWLRTAKTIGRRMLRLDDSTRTEMARQLGQSLPRHYRVLHMDAAHMTFPPASFDFVYSFSVFEHLADPAAVMARIEEVLRPGGVAYISLHPFTSESGSHDPRIFTGHRDDLPYWPHLRPAYRDRVHSNSYLNELRLPEWRELFTRCWPGVRFHCIQTHRDELRRRLEEIRADGGLAEYEDQELLTGEFVALWQKPG